MEGNTVPFCVADAFSPSGHSGNQAAVILTDAPLEVVEMQAIAQEFNLSETAFLHPLPLVASEHGHYSLRWFTPTVEVELCGHATLASAHALRCFYRSPSVDRQPKFVFHTRYRGELEVKWDEEGNYTMLLPAGDPQPAPLDVELQQQLCAALGIQQSAIVNIHCCNITAKLLVEVRDGDVVRAAAPSTSALLALQFPTQYDVRGVCVTTRHCNEESHQIESRYFAPWRGIPEDPVTGSLHTALAVYYQAVSAKMHAYQASSRGGDLLIQWLPHSQRVTVGGRATITSTGTCLRPA